MSHRKVTFSLDPVILFDVLRKMNDHGEALGARLVCALLAPISAREAVGLLSYGIMIEGESVIEEPSAPAPAANDGREKE